MYFTICLFLDHPIIEADFSNGNQNISMSAGRGFIGLAAMIVGRWTPIGAFGAALLFASSTAIGRAISFAAPDNSMGDFLKGIPPQFYDALPYLVTIIILAGVIGRSIPPAADGQPYEREAAA